MQRRSFIKLSAVTFTSLLGQAGCRDSDSGGDPGPREIVDAPQMFPQSVASGDPKANTVVLWTRVEDADLPDEDYEVELEIWPLSDDGEDEDHDDGEDHEHGEEGDEDAVTVVAVTSEARFDHCVKVRAEGLEPGTIYGYRFFYIKDGVSQGSQTGQAKTAPASDDDTAVRFAFVSCQDFGGKYYNAYAHLLEQELDFFVHLGDYIYETAGDSSFQDGDADREVIFDDEAGALPLTSSDGSTFFAARSLDNYRQLYRTFRTDLALQAVHERLPMVAIWDDHEFSDDCHGSTGTYTDGREDETDPARRAAANQAWFEYMPVDYADPGFVYDTAVPPPTDIRIYRDIEYGRHVHLVMTDLRSYRPDHLVAEDAYPGAMALDEPALLSVADDTSGGVPYVDVETHAGGAYLEVLREAAGAADYDGGRITGNVSAIFINDVIEDTGAAVAPIEQTELDTLPRGIAFHQMFKASYYGQLGARYLVTRDPFHLYAQWRNDTSDGADQSILGQEQQDWFLQTMNGSGHTWKIWGNEFCLTPLEIDLSASAGLPETFQQAFQMSVEDWSGAPQRRTELINALSGVDNVVAITGDVHSFFAGTPFAGTGASEGNSVVEFVTGSITSTPYRSILVRQVQADPGLSSVSGIEAFALGIGDLLQGGPNPQMGFADTGRHGFGVVTANGEQLVVDFHMHPEELTASARYDEDLTGEFITERFRVLPGSRDLYRDFDGTWRRWDATTRTWVE
ncbi:MAG: alkaline phosphatase D family protein [Deltaproteobacteria bacterium]|nr:alkaline phosphatase D family protein [Deltaproteobacteria bacterium]